MDGVKIAMGDHNKPIVTFRTDSGRVFKAIAAILNANFTQATLIVAEQGIFIQESVPDGTVTFDVRLSRQCFLEYIIPKIAGEGSKFICLGFSTSDFKAATDNIAKSDNVALTVHPSNMDRVSITINKKNSKTLLERHFALQETRVGDIVPPIYEDHLPTVTVSVSEFRQTMVNLKKSCKKGKLHVYAQENGIRIVDVNSQLSGGGGIMGNWNNTQQPTCMFVIPCTRLYSFSEVNAIDPQDTIRIYAMPGMPLRLCTHGTSLGIMNMYLISSPDP